MPTPTTPPPALGPRTGGILGTMLLLIVAGAARADGAVPTWRDHFTLTASLRVRGELADWFAPPADAAAPGAERWAFFASQVRLGLRAVFPYVEVFVEGQDTRLAGLPDDATLGAPFGPLGPAGLYYLFGRSTTQGEAFLKQGFVRLRRGLASATLGRFEYREGLETLPFDATLAFVKRTRIAERLVGPFDFTHVTRSFDGARLAYDRLSWNATALGARPTRGGFNVSANRDIEDVAVAGLALTAKRLPFGPPVDARLFYLYYDDRRGLPKVDNTPTGGAVDTAAIAIHTIGAHALTAIDAGPGIADLLLWVAGQTGDWGHRTHSAWAYAVEAGYQLPRLPWSPWLRVGLDCSSGDSNPRDGRHQTFFQMLPTARTYAQLPFFNLMNMNDVFESLVLRPSRIVTIRSDVHWLRLGDRHDLWYSGGGAQSQDIFGFTGTPSSGHRALAYLVDLSASVAVTSWMTLGGYYGHAFGGNVVGGTFDGRDADYAFIEMTLRY